MDDCGIQIMFLQNYYSEENKKIHFSRQQASRFAKEIAGDFNPIHDPEAKRFCVPGDLLFALVMIVFTIPYLALQPMAAGYALEALVGLPYQHGCFLVTGIILLYTLRGGLRAVAWTDLFQGLLMLIAIIVVSVLAGLTVRDGFQTWEDSYWTPAGVEGTHPLLSLDTSITLGALELVATGDVVEPPGIEPGSR